MELIELGVWGKIRGTLLGVPIRRTIVFGGLYWGPPILGIYHWIFRGQTSVLSNLWGLDFYIAL